MQRSLIQRGKPAQPRTQTSTYSSSANHTPCACCVPQDELSFQNDASVFSACDYRKFWFPPPDCSLLACRQIAYTCLNELVLDTTYCQLKWAMVADGKTRALYSTLKDAVSISVISLSQCAMVITMEVRTFVCVFSNICMEQLLSSTGPRSEIKQLTIYLSPHSLLFVTIAKCWIWVPCAGVVMSCNATCGNTSFASCC